MSCYFIEYSEIFGGYKFYDPTTKSVFESENVWFFKDVEFARRNASRNIVFYEKYVNIPIYAISIDQDFISDLIQDTTDQDNVRKPLIQEIIPEEQTPAPQEPMPLRRSTRDRISAMLDNHIVFLQEHKVDIGVMV